LITLVVRFYRRGLDESGASSIAGLGWLAGLPAPHRLAIEVLIGVPVVFGAALYFIRPLLSWLGSPAGRPGGWLRRFAATR
jgi:hypothetical protein